MFEPFLASCTVLDLTLRMVEIELVAFISSFFFGETSAAAGPVPMPLWVHHERWPMANILRWMLEQPKHPPPPSVHHWYELSL